MADDSTQQQQPGLLSQIGSGLGQVLPYAIPAALGAVMGRGVGGGPLAGALAGAGMAAGDIQEQQQKQKELQMEQQRLQIEAQEADIEIQKGKLALGDAADQKAYAKGIKDPDERRMYLDDPKTYFANMQWKNFSTVLGKDPTFKTNNPELAQMLPSLPPEMGQKLLEQSLSGKYQHILPPTKQKDGTWAAEAIKPDGTVDYIPTGDPTSLVVKETAGAGAGAALDKATLAAVRSEYDQRRKANLALQGVGTSIGIRSLPYPDLPDTFEDYLSSDEGQSAISKVQMRGKAPVGKVGDPNAALAGAALPKGKPPKELWGTTGTINGKRVTIDASGNVAPAK